MNSTCKDKRDTTITIVSPCVEGMIRRHVYLLNSNATITIVFPPKKINKKALVPNLLIWPFFFNLVINFLTIYPIFSVNFDSKLLIRILAVLHDTVSTDVNNLWNVLVSFLNFVSFFPSSFLSFFFFLSFFLFFSTGPRRWWSGRPCRQ